MHCATHHGLILFDQNFSFAATKENREPDALYNIESIKGVYFEEDFKRLLVKT